MLRPLALVLPATGWGTIEVVEADIDFDLPGDPKTGDRSVPIPADLVALLQSWLAIGAFEAGDLLFRSVHGNRPSPSNWRRAWHLALAKIDHEPRRPQDCRHFAATCWLHAGVPLGEVARRMGHSVETLVATWTRNSWVVRATPYPEHRLRDRDVRCVVVCAAEKTRPVCGRLIRAGLFVVR